MARTSSAVFDQMKGLGDPKKGIPLPPPVEIALGSHIPTRTAIRPILNSRTRDRTSKVLPMSSDKSVTYVPGRTVFRVARVSKRCRRGVRVYSITSSKSFASTLSPTATSLLVTSPATGELTVVCIFIASITTSLSPF